MAGIAPIALTIAGSDSGGGAGIQADLKTFSSLGVYGASVITALTAQNTLGVAAIHDVPADFVAAQMDSVFSDLAISAVKVGMLSQRDVINTVSERLIAHGATKVVLDPVMVAASGDALLEREAERDIIERLFPLAMLVTPNVLEAATLLDTKPAATRNDMVDQAEAILGLGAGAVLLKGGHVLDDQESADLLVTRSMGATWFTVPRTHTPNTHGTGCTLSSAIASGLARGQDLIPAIRSAKTYITLAIAGADALEIGRGHGPVHHFHAFWGHLDATAE